jgi:hypothetical protein
MMRYLIATNCTNRKRFSPPRTLQGKYLPRDTAKVVAKEWVRRIKEAEPVTVATDLYQGRAFNEAKAAAKTLSAGLYIISAGLGLINSQRRVPSYNLTVTEKSSDNVLHRCTDETAAADWWALLNGALRSTSLSSRIARSTQDRWLIAVPSTYYRMLRRDLARLRKSDLERVRLFGPRQIDESDPVLQRTLVVVDDRLDGADSDVRGTRGDFAQRSMMFFISHVLSAFPDADIASHREVLKRTLRRMAWPKVVPPRAFATDDEICKKLDQFWIKGNGQSTKLLRIFRDELAIACEESRFRKLFHIVARRRGAE